MSWLEWKVMVLTVDRSLKMEWTYLQFYQYEVEPERCFFKLKSQFWVFLLAFDFLSILRSHSFNKSSCTIGLEKQIHKSRSTIGLDKTKT